ncbi:hypothetical protein Tco_0889622 [Tanacetum coccineum]
MSSAPSSCVSFVRDFNEQIPALNKLCASSNQSKPLIRPTLWENGGLPAWKGVVFGGKVSGGGGRNAGIVLSVEDKFDYLEQPIPPAPVPAQVGQQVAPEALAARTAWVKGSKEIAGLMLTTMEPDIQRNLENLSAYDMLQELKTLFAQQAEQELLQTVRDFHFCKQEEGQSVSSYVLKMKSYIDNLERLGHPVSLNLGVSLILISLRQEFDSFVQNYNMHNMGKTVNEFHAMLKLHEQTLTKKDPALHAILAGKV